jgi:hypothetical protein
MPIIFSNFMISFIFNKNYNFLYENPEFNTCISVKKN